MSVPDPRDPVCVQVGIEAIENKSGQLAAEVARSPPDLTKLHLLLQGSISAQVGGGHVTVMWSSALFHGGSNTSEGMSVYSVSANSP